MIVDYLKRKGAVFVEQAHLLEAKTEVVSSALPSAENICSYLKPLRDRDRIKITLIDDLDHELALTADTPNANDLYTAFRGRHDENHLFEIRLKITKTLQDGVISVYNFKSFQDQLLQKSIPQMLTSLAKLYEQSEHICFELLDQDPKAPVEFHTGTMAFTSDPGSVRWDPVDRKQRRLQWEAASEFEQLELYPLIPEDFSIRTDSGKHELKERFDQICSILSLTALAERSTIKEGRLQLRFDRKGDFTYDYVPEKLPPNPVLYDIYHLVYAKGNAVDKVLLARNVICRHLETERLEKLGDGVLDIINTHYTLYLRENVEKYIELTNAMAGFIKDSIQGVTDSISQLFGNLKTNLMAMLSFLFTVVLADAVSEQSLDNLFTTEIKWILYVVLIGSAVYYGMSILEVHYAKKQMVKQYHALQRHYQRVLSSDEINEITGNGALLSQATRDLRRGAILLTILWLGLVLIAFVVIDYLGEDPHLLRPLFTAVRDYFSDLTRP